MSSSCPKPAELDYMSSKASAFMIANQFYEKLILWMVFFIFFIFLIWAYFTQIDELARGMGRVIPSGKTQVIQNLEGGIIKDILVFEGDNIKQNDILLRIDNSQSFSNFEEKQTTYHELLARSIRLKAEFQGEPFIILPTMDKRLQQYLKTEKKLYKTNTMQLKNRIEIYKSQKTQKESELNEMQFRIQALKESLSLLKREIAIKKPLVDRGIEPEVNFLKLKREASNLSGDYYSLKAALPRINSAIDEINQKIIEEELNYQKNVQREYTTLIAELERTKTMQDSYGDKVTRTDVRSPVNGTVKQIFVNTIGGVIKPGMDLVEIVPTDEALLIVAKITPADIAFIHPNQKARIRFTAYDYSIYGGLDGIVTHISADSLVDEDGENYYEIKIKAEKSYLEKSGNKFQIIPGMVAKVDIFTGRKSVIDYLLKPILKASDNAFHER